MNLGQDLELHPTFFGAINSNFCVKSYDVRTDTDVSEPCVKVLQGTRVGCLSHQVSRQVLLEAFL